MHNTIAVAMSGGVDSSVAAWLLRQEGWETAGVTLRLFQPENLAPGRGEACHALQDAEDARAVAAQLGIPHYTLDLSDRFAQCVMDPFAAEYEAGRTPNPCVVCNRTIKFGALLDEADKLGYSLLATGHYAQVERDERSGRFLLKKALHSEKDQSYVLWSLTQAQLARVRLPLGRLSKEEIRTIAQEHGLVSARKQDSQDICFVPDGDYAAFLQHHTGREYPSGAPGAGGVLQPGAAVCAAGPAGGQRRGAGGQRLPVPQNPHRPGAESDPYGASGGPSEGMGQGALPHGPPARRAGADRSGHRPGHL